jgi:CyaY protein
MFAEASGTGDKYTRGHIGVKSAAEKMMKDSEFNDLVDQTFDAIEDSLDNMDVDFDQAEGVLNIECANGSMIILSRQVATSEIWIAARSGGFHLAFADGTWNCSKTNESLRELLERVLGEQMGEVVNLEFG